MADRFYLWLVLLLVCVSGSGVESPARDGESPVHENMHEYGCCVSSVAAGSWNLS